MFDPCVIPKHRKHKTPDAETGENRSIPRQLQRGVEHLLQWCESSSAEQTTVYTRLAASTQVFHRSRKKCHTRKHWTLQHAKTFVNRKKTKQKFAFKLCSAHVLFPNITSIKRQMQRQEKTSHFHVNSKEEWKKLYDGVNIRVQSNRQITQHIRQWHKSSIEAGKKISKGSIGPYSTPNTCKPERDSQQKFTFHICSNHLLISNITSLKRQMQRQERTGQFHVNSKEEWNIIHDGVNHRVQSNRQFTQDIRQWHKSSIEAEKNISPASSGPYKKSKQL